MKKFEYKKVDIGNFDSIDEGMLNKYGEEGWELIHIDVEKKVYLFKREIPFVETRKTAKQLLQE